jgi:NAD(P)-dependent dehydrogenase (short-subunit alcohol dehydrogenase family)
VKVTDRTAARKTVIVGASSGLGRSIAIGLGQRGDTVALLARRHSRLVAAAEEAGSGSLAIACDVTDSAACGAAIEEAAREMGGIDALLYATGIAHLGRLTDVDSEGWRRTFETNVIGAAQVTAAAMPYLAASHGVAAYLSSVNGSLTPPWPGLGVYASSKAALETLVEAWRAEHPEVGFTRIIVGDCAGGEGDSATEFVNNWDVDLLTELFPIWERRNLLAGSLMEVGELVRLVDFVLGCGASASIPLVVIAPRAPAG